MTGNGKNGAPIQVPFWKKAVALILFGPGVAVIGDKDGAIAVGNDDGHDDGMVDGGVMVGKDDGNVVGDTDRLGG